jgi:hypothetical protein
VARFGFGVRVVFRLLIFRSFLADLGGIRYFSHRFRVVGYCGVYCFNFLCYFAHYKNPSWVVVEKELWSSMPLSLAPKGGHAAAWGRNGVLVAGLPLNEPSRRFLKRFPVILCDPL